MQALGYQGLYQPAHLQINNDQHLYQQTHLQVNNQKNLEDQREV